MIKQMGYQGYFLIVWDFIRYARERGIPVGPGRGSAAGSLVAWCMRITDVDPIDFDLIFERFLNPERVSLPDIDVDFCERRRGEVIDYVTRKYGRENVAQIITFGTMKAKAVVRDVGRALDMPFADVDRIAKQIPPALDMTLDKALAENPVLKKMAADDPRVKEVIDIGRRLEGMSRHASVHAAGVVIAPGPITDYAPLYKGARDEITTQWNMKEVERVGLLKMDFLGLSTLTLIQDCLAEIKRTEGVELDIDTVPLDDAATYKVFGEGAAYGIFQFESSGMRELLRKAKPERLDDLIALNALYRPGPLKSGMVDDWVERKQGKREVKYELKELEPILSDTYGVIAYQEQVMRIAQALAGFSLGQADVLRKAMGKKDPKVMAKQRDAFMDGARAQKVNEKKAAKIFELMEYFAGYGFNKSHSTAYAFLAYQTGVPQGELPVALRRGAPDHRVAEHRQAGGVSGRVPRAERAGAAARRQHQPVELLGGEGPRRTLRPRRHQGPRRRRRAGPRGRADGARRPHHVAARALRDPRPAHGQQARLRGAGEVGRLRLAAAADGRRGVARAAGAALRVDRIGDGARQPDAARQGSGPGRSLRRRRATAGPVTVALPDVPAWSEIDQLNFEKESLGSVLERSPGGPLRGRPGGARGQDDCRPAAEARGGRGGGGGRRRWRRPTRPRPRTKAPGGRCRRPRPWPRTCRSAASSAACARSRRARATACASSCSTIRTAASRWWCSRKRSSSAATWRRTAGWCVVKGRFERDDESARMLAEEISPIELVSERLATSVAIRVSTPPHGRATFERLWDVLAQHKGDRCVAFDIELQQPDKRLRVRVDVNAQIRVRPSDRLVSDVEKICGAGSVVIGRAARGRRH